MELQTFTFFLLAFVALTDGVPRDLMDDSIDMTKPEHAKADLARARTRRAEGDWESIEVTSGEAQLAAIVANDWYKEEYGIRSFVKYIMDAKKKKNFYGRLHYRVSLDLYLDHESLGVCVFNIDMPMPDAHAPAHVQAPPHIWINEEDSTLTCTPTTNFPTTNDM